MIADSELIETVLSCVCIMDEPLWCCFRPLDGLDPADKDLI